ncbi:platelet glycoprotein Ib alpha chain isoform X1 [Culex pipiens pallens]|uniref:platelet glycoprotein Ib alpha chain isoform X1 n=1 Tax=Culex pipiens pallens TaxID=42434 RepID=UPI001954E5E7|nr:platelet glycoprotein Ib alpha chain isoform X1 [Culex pipiens pallens]
MPRITPPPPTTRPLTTLPQPSVMLPQLMPPQLSTTPPRPCTTRLPRSLRPPTPPMDMPRTVMPPTDMLPMLRPRTDMPRTDTPPMPLPWSVRLWPPPRWLTRPHSPLPTPEPLFRSPVWEPSTPGKKEQNYLPLKDMGTLLGAGIHQELPAITPLKRPWNRHPDNRFTADPSECAATHLRGVVTCRPLSRLRTHTHTPQSRKRAAYYFVHRF